MKLRILLIAIFWLLVLHAFAQQNPNDFMLKSLKTQNAGMIILGSWAVANLVSGGYGWASTTGQRKYFHQMNFIWNVVNLSIAGFALYNNSSTQIEHFQTAEFLAKHLKTEKILLINSALDVGYIGAGLLLKHYGAKPDNYKSLLSGYGNSLILQGAFLLVFDLTLYQVLHNQRLGCISVNPSADLAGLTLRYSF